MHPGYTDSATENFLARVQEHNGLESRAEADQLSRATLSALAQCVSAGQMDDLTAGLPEDLHSAIEAGTRQAKSFDKRTFLDQISGGIGSVDMSEVERKTQGVLRTLREWAPEGQSSDTIAQLPPELARLFAPSGSQAGG
ncbi:uncharacterized protein (DUF2267 family) [Haloactinospora alba]|uniref:Uncharacterized protein (DUF2267 family) n=1 Tax=Haloactinospora alba TaxID=405555 RepID=A0A543NL55_9ACTN|nr:DUF2267 domain-containing protein [Haloactinospora alba]TQN32542.1 uncharacterized protein (DUF2267 family) [Haloactinospora alba]